MRGRFYTPRESLIPKGAVKVSDKQSDAVAYIFNNKGGKPCAMVFFGKQAKPVAHYRYQTEDRRSASIAEMFERRQAHGNLMAERAAKAKAFVHDCKVGDIYHTSWGYDQTNVEFFEVIEVRGKFAILRELQQASQETEWLQGDCVPQSGLYVEPRYEGDDRGLPIRRLIQEHGIKIDDVRTAWKWNTTNVAGVPMGRTLHWSAYH